ncbi:hypothetical protein BFP97_14865 [Roseivirga sp. 4D4]|uniref:DNA cytosine methyltransferase n=1 Tax=Roseivirga sp. 4D4 TaxID=1889784 RepID=UPI000853D520|nr:DNA (cytosine-5-)-methyltransferase [Roseivirga sp. 4D4]OEK02727.1 hypothetical protein BFP97_14865 [Roseivirga sp. 4D4]
MKAIDLYSGIGGWTLGFKMAGIEVVSSFEWWKDANETHNANFGTKHKEKNIRELDVYSDLPPKDEIDFVVGSPPCTQFSFANRGGNGDLVDGLVDVAKFLEVVDYIKPKYWAMENVPRVAGIIEKSIEKGGPLERYSHLFDDQFRVIKVYNSADYGVPQNRKRMIAGRFPFGLFESYQEVTPRRTLGEVVMGLKRENLLDPIYGHSLKTLTDNIHEAPLTDEEKRINSDSKTHHPVYNKMSFPDILDRPSRTITALCTRVSRESIIIEDDPEKYRRLTVRERGCVQTFPADYQFHSNSYGGKLKMIGNAVPPLLTYYIAQSMLETSLDEVAVPVSEGRINLSTENVPKFFSPESKGSKFSWKRSFWLAVPGLRLGSGVRFELRNVSNKEIEKTFWWVNFCYGNSKNLMQFPLDKRSFETVWESLQIMALDCEIGDILMNFQDFVASVDAPGLQENWTNKDRSKNNPIELIDDIGRFASELVERLNRSDAMTLDKLRELVGFIGLGEQRKLMENANIIVSGILLGSIFNTVITGDRFVLDLELQD